MSTPLTGWRDAYSTVFLSGADLDTQILDFQLQVRDGIEIAAISPMLMVESGNSATPEVAIVSLHADDGALQDPNWADAADQFVRDSEIVWGQSATVVLNSAVDANRAALLVTPNETYVPPQPILLAINPTHRVEGFDAVTVLKSTLHIVYRYVRLTDAELGFFFARRR